MQQNDTTPTPAADGPQPATEAMHQLIDQRTFHCFADIAQEFELSTGSAMLLAFDSLLAHLAAGGSARRKLLAELLRILARRAGSSATATPASVRVLELDHRRANAALLAEIDRELAQARAAGAAAASP